MRSKQKVYRQVLLFMLAVTRTLQKADYNIPVKWYSVIESLRASSGVLHQRIRMNHEDIDEEFVHVEKQIDRRMGGEKFYDEHEIEELQEKIEEIKV